MFFIPLKPPAATSRKSCLLKALFSVVVRDSYWGKQDKASFPVVVRDAC